jgi:hypothetical protein
MGLFAHFLVFFFAVSGEDAKWQTVTFFVVLTELEP